MKLRVMDRLLGGLMGLILIVDGLASLLCTLGVLKGIPGGDFLAGLTGWMRWAAIGTSVVLMLLGLYGLSILFRRRRDKGFVIQRTEYGDMSISMKAMENMVRKCVDSHEELTVNSTHIYRVRDGVQVEVRITLPSGANIPLTVNALQRQIKQYITSCSGVDVTQVRVKVETDIAKLAAPAPVPALENPVVAEEEAQPEPAAAELCRHQEPLSYDSPAEEETVVETQEEPAVEMALDEEPVEEPAEETEAEVEIAEAEAAEEAEA